MSDKFNLKKSGWFDENGAENDVIVSSRICLSRNISRMLFPSKMDRITEEHFFDTVKDAVTGLDSGSLVKISSLDYSEKKLLSERRYIKSGASFERDPSIFIPDNEKFVVVFNQKDHIRIKSFKGGLDLRTAYNNCNSVDNILEEKISYAWSDKFGYLNSSLTETGTGMKSSVMLYLPAITRNGKIDKVMKDIVQAGLSVTGFVGEGENSAGDLYIIDNQFSMGETEENIIKKIETISLMLTDFERESRDYLYRKDPDSLEDEIMRAYGLLKY